MTRSGWQLGSTFLHVMGFIVEVEPQELSQEAQCQQLISPRIGSVLFKKNLVSHLEGSDHNT